MFYTIGLIISLVAIAKIANFLWTRYNRKEFEWDNGNGRYWAVVTGSTDGIGFEFARQLGLKGYNLMLISRNPTKLSNVQNKILTECPNIEIRTCEIDFKRNDIQNYDKIKKFLDVEQNDIYILINNVGFGPQNLKHFADESEEHHQDMVNVNLISTMRMTELILPSLRAKGRGLIVNVSSFVALHTSPSISAYGATKAFVSYLSRALYEECFRHNVLIFLLEPGSVSTNLLKLKSSIMVPEAKTYVKNALDAINWTTPESLGYFPHFIGHLMIQGMEFIIGPHKTARIIEKFSIKTVNQDQARSTINLKDMLGLLFNKKSR